MAERDRSIYCAQCGNIVGPDDNFCGTCGARAPGAATARHTPTQPAPAPGRNMTPLIVLGIGVLLVLMLGAGSVAAWSLLRGGGDSPESANQGNAAGDTPETTRPEENTTPQPDQDEEGAENDGPSPEEASGYSPIGTPDGGLSAEVPTSWEVEVGADSEKTGGPNSWSYQAGEYLYSSITTAPNLDAWYSTGTSGAYFVASRALAQYSDYELTNSLFNAGKNESCTVGPYKDYNRPPLSGKLQTWYECGVDDATVYTLAAAPESRECVVALNARVSEEADREAIEHLVDTFEVDCARVTSSPLATPSASPAASP